MQQLISVMNEWVEWTEPGLPRHATLSRRLWESAWELLIDHSSDYCMPTETRPRRRELHQVNSARVGRYCDVTRQI